MQNTIESIKVLVVEDFDMMRKMQIKTLDTIGFKNVLGAENGKKALEALNSEKDIGLIICDWFMPEMNGFDFLTQLRKNKQYIDIPFIMATALSERENAMKALDAGADRYITKPFSAGELKEVIDDIFFPKEAEIKVPSTKKIIEKNAKPKVKVAHIQITDHLALGILNHLIETGHEIPKYFDLQTHCMTGWNPVQDALEKGEVDAAFILAPLAMDMFHSGVPIKLLLFAHKNGSICVRSSQKGDRQTLHDFLKSKKFYLPHTLSIHHMLADMFMSEIGLKLGPVGKEGVDVFVEVVPPVNMPEFLKDNPEASGFAVAEPVGTSAINAEICDLLFYTAELWQNHPCCVLAVREDFIEMQTDAVYEMIQLLVKAGQFIGRNTEVSSIVASNFLDPNKKLGLSPLLMEGVLSQPGGINTDDMFPVIEDLDRIQRYLKNTMGIGSIIDLEKFVDTRFAKAACETHISSGNQSVIQCPDALMTKVIRRQISNKKRNDPIEIKTDYQEILEVNHSENEIHFRISTDPKLVERIIQESRIFITQKGFKAFSGLNLILRELLGNAVEHGNKGVKSKLITCSITQIRDALFKITVEDQGEGFDFNSLNMNIPEDHFQLRNRGYPFIHTFSEEIIFEKNGSRVTVWHRIFTETRFDVVKNKDCVTIRPSGNITGSDVKKLRTLLKTLTDEACVRFRFDFSSVKDIDSMGISVLIILSRMLVNQPDTSLEIININAEIAHLLSITHLNEVYRIDSGQRKSQKKKM